MLTNMELNNLLLG